MSELPKAYDPRAVEPNWYSRWMEADCFVADPNSTKPPYSIVIPPPNVTGILHLGHVLNNTLQDILARRARQKGHEVLWLPGADHAGIATQTKVERHLRETLGKNKHEVGREEFLKHVWEWKEKHGGIIINQLKRLGCSCDWGKERFTLDENYSEWVKHVFAELFKQGLIYRGKRMVNWCPSTQTALSDEEVIMTPKKSKLYYMKYELVDTPGEYLEIATTRPETLMGDTAVAVNPNDPRYAQFVGKSVYRPFPKAKIPIVPDEHIDPEFGTGVLKVTPAHDRADFEIGVRHNLPIIDILHADGRVNSPEIPQLHGLDRFEARDKAAQMLEKMGLIIKIEEHENNVGFSERAGVPIEPRLSMQWFLKYPAVKEATEAVASGEIQYRPKRWAKTYAHWMENIQDWCISRQLWWGHRIPVWYKKENAQALREAASLDSRNLEGGEIHVSTTPPPDPENWEQDEDVLDTWFSSWLWPFSTMEDLGEESDLLKKFYPTTDLVTGPDIIFFWVARMVMAGFHFKGEIPFKNVYFTPLIRDLQGRKMSKSLGNSPDPVKLMENYGADGLRFGLLRITPSGSDVRFDESQIKEGRNFANKLYNACRFRQMAEGEANTSLKADNLNVFQLDICAKLEQLAVNLEQAYAEYRFHEVVQKLYEFLWSDFCDLFLEAVKGDLKPEAPAKLKEATLNTFDAVMSRYLQLLHPVMPHITEELATRLGYLNAEDFLMQQCLPKSSLLEEIDEKGIKLAQNKASDLYETAARFRNLKAEYNLSNRKDALFHLKQGTGTPLLDTEVEILALLAGAKEIIIEKNYAPKQGTPATLTPIGETWMPLDGLIDLKAEKERLDKELEKIEKELEKALKKLKNPQFLERAKPEVVQKEKERLAEWKSRHSQICKLRDGLPPNNE